VSLSRALALASPFHCSRIHRATARSPARSLARPQLAAAVARGYEPRTAADISPPAFEKAAAGLGEASPAGGAPPLDLLDCLEAQRRAERLTGDDRWFCGACKAHVDATKR
jgi:hypothetical protein